MKVPSFQSASVAQILVLPALMEYELITGISVDFSATEEFSTVVTRTYFALPSAEISTVFLPFFSSADWEAFTVLPSSEVSTVAVAEAAPVISAL